ncbi:MAG: cobyrinate a,c-diamide synthase [Pseudomonadota bacterium]
MSVSSKAEPRGLVIAAPNSNTGKTVFTLGLVGALIARGVRTQVAKGGPGFIDPQFLSLATGQPAYNLDKWALGEAQLRARASHLALGHDLLIIEGMMGMFDGAASMSGSTADLAATLDLPVLLLIDASGLAQSIAAIAHGFASLRPRPKICGVVATRVGSEGHTAMLREAMAETGIPFLGAVARSDALTIPSRHLGLLQAEEMADIAQLASAAAEAVGAGVDLEAVMKLAGKIPMRGTPNRVPPLGQRIAVARDIAFAFAYPHILGDWQAQGADIVPFSPLANEAPASDCDAIYLPGGYPELHCGTLAAADRFLTGLRDAAARGTVIYGECGGYMVLGKTLIDADDQAHAMAGLLDHVVSFSEPQMHLGYRQLTPQHAALGALPLRGHEFHYSRLDDPGTDAPLFDCYDAKGRHLGHTGGQRGSVFGSYMHMINQAPD